MQWKTSQIGRRLTVAIVAFSSFLTFLLTSYQLWLDYHTELDDIQKQLAFVEASYSRSIEESIWTFNKKQTDLQLEGALNLPDLVFAQVHDQNDTLLAEAGKRPENSYLRKSIPIVRAQKGSTWTLGTLTIFATVENVQQRLLDRILTMLINNAIKTFFVSGMILILVRKFVTSRLVDLANKVRRINKSTIIGDVIPLSELKDREDDFAIVYETFVDMQVRLIEAFDEQKRLVETIESASDFIGIADPQGNFLYLNDAAKTNLGLQGSSAVNPKISDLFPEQDSSFHLDENWGGEKAKEILRSQSLLQVPSGDPIPVSVIISTHRDSEDKVHFVSVIARDISNLREIENQLKVSLRKETLARREAESASRLKDEFLMVLSHELRTPLTPVLGWCQLLKSKQLSESKEEEALDAIHRSATVQLRLIDDLLQVSRIISGKMQLSSEVVDLNRILREAVFSVEVAAVSQGIKVHSEGIEDKIEVYGDNLRLQQIFWNLLSNAVKFSDSGDEVFLSVKQTESHVIITVADQGVGISPDFLPNVFDRFVQADYSTTRKYGGLGLGLSLVKSLTELHNGKVKAFSEGPGKGATFEVQLPLASTTKPGSQSVQELPVTDPGEIKPTLSKAKILVVDDNEENLGVILDYLRSVGSVAIGVSSAAEAFEVVHSMKPSLLISDIGMPGKDGYWLITQIRESEDASIAKIPALAVTAWCNEVDIQKAAEKGFNAILGKPYDIEELVARIVALLPRK